MKRVAFSFDEPSYHALYAMTERLGLKNAAQTIRVALILLRTLELERGKGYSKITLCNPKTGKERTLSVQALEGDGNG